mmetsp:Transcript_229/g.931  ORF Transcript_229/g.931 Transcript_229/m.931 type:complete len:203 (-) Transcript_229:3370-3978(-)
MAARAAARMRALHVCTAGRRRFGTGRRRRRPVPASLRRRASRGHRISRDCAFGGHHSNRRGAPRGSRSVGGDPRRSARSRGVTAGVFALGARHSRARVGEPGSARAGREGCDGHGQGRERCVRRDDSRDEAGDGHRAYRGGRGRRNRAGHAAVGRRLCVLLRRRREAVAENAFGSEGTGETTRASRGRASRKRRRCQTCPRS